MLNIIPLHNKVQHNTRQKHENKSPLWLTHQHVSVNSCRNISNSLRTLSTACICTEQHL